MKFTRQKQLLLTLTLGALLSSCSGTNRMEGRDGILKKREQTNSNEQVASAVDLDGDGFTKEDKRPRIADFPRILLGEVKHSEIRFEKNDNSTRVEDTLKKKEIEKERKKRLRQKILNLHYKKVVFHSGTQLKNLINFRDLMTAPLFKWRDEHYYPFLDLLRRKEFFPYGATLESLIKLRLRGTEGVSEIHDVEYRVGKKNFSEKKRLIDTNGNPETFKTFEKKGQVHPKIISLVDSDNESIAMKDLIKKRKTPRLRIDDFTYKREGKFLKFSETMAKIQKKSALMIISGPKTPLKYAYVKAGGKVGESFKIMHGDVELNDDGEVKALDNMQNGLSVPVDMSNLQREDLKANTLQLMGASSANDLTKPGNVYILSGAKSKSLTKFYTPKEKKRYKTQNSVINLGKLYPGQVLTMEISVQQKIPFRSKGRKKVSYRGTKCTVHNADGIGIGQTTCRFVGKRQNVRWWKKGWKNQRLNFVKESLKHMKLGFGKKRFAISKLLLEGESPAIFAGDKTMTLRIKIPKSLMTRSRATLKFDFPKETKNLRLGFAGGFSCPGRYRSCKKNFSTGKRNHRVAEKQIYNVAVKY